MPGNRPPRDHAAMGKSRQRLAEAVQARRVELGMRSQRALAEAAGVSIRTVGSMERGDKIGANSARSLEVALGWAPGSIDAINDGGEPTPRGGSGGAAVKHRKRSQSGLSDVRITGYAQALFTWIQANDEDAFAESYARLEDQYGEDGAELIAQRMRELMRAPEGYRKAE